MQLFYDLLIGHFSRLLECLRAPKIVMFLIQYWTSPFANLKNIRALGFALEDIMLKLKPILIFDVIYNFTNLNVMIYHPLFHCIVHVCVTGSLWHSLLATQGVWCQGYHSWANIWLVQDIVGSTQLILICEHSFYGF